MTQRIPARRLPALLAVPLAAIAMAVPVDAQQDQAFRNKTRKSLSNGLIRCLVVYEFSKMDEKIPPLQDAFERYNNHTEGYFTKYRNDARKVLSADSDFMSSLDIEARVCDTLTPEQIDLGDSMRLEAWRDGDALQ